MPFDQPTRNLLARFVGDARSLLTEEFTRQLQQEYGLDPERGEATDLSRLGHLDDARRATALLLRETLAHYLAGQPKPDAKARREALDRIVREQAFTILNRLCALRIAEGRGLLIESVGQGHRSRGFQLYGHLAGTGLGETGDAYRCYLFSLFDELALELPVLFDRYAPEGRLFPREVALSQVLALINAPEIAPLWAEDETIGWIYQYFNSVEERRQMRAESAAPRNSRELAVRNQFFTPRYVVEFLTDNTLGRIWYEMTKGETSLTETCRYLVRRPTEIFLTEGEEAPQQNQPAEDLPQEELLRQPVYIPHRPLKDPRDILMLDPACGSLHFGLYAFDLYERIYDEAWELEGVLGAAAFIRSDGLLPLRESYPDKTAFRADVPRLIIERNIHGIDIDPRAVQIAGLSLWLRAQRSWQAQGIKPQDRPQIRRSNIVCAEPMPGDRALLEEFLKTLRDERLEGLIRRVLKTPANQRVRATPTMADALCDLVRTVWKEMELAGEAGSLLKIEEALADAVARGKAEWDEKMPLFRVAEFGLTEQGDETPTIRYYKTIPGEKDADFWDRAEALVLAALQDYAERTENGGGYRRRLFAGDAAQGFAFIDLCRKRYDSVLMNPPFGAAALRALPYLEDSYIDSKSDILQSFVERSQRLLCRGCYLGAITSRTPLFLGQSQDWRERVVLRLYRPAYLADFGPGVLEAAVDTAAYVLRTLTEHEENGLVGELVHDLRKVEGSSDGSFSVNRYVAARKDKIKKHQAFQELNLLIEHGFVKAVYFNQSLRFVRNSVAAPPNTSTSFATFTIDCFRLIDATNKGEDLLDAIRREGSNCRFAVHSADLLKIPGLPFAYWVGSQVSSLFQRFPPFQSDGRVVQQGLSTKDDYRYFRNWWEVPHALIADPELNRQETGRRAVWYRVSRGSAYTDHVVALDQVLNWSDNARELEADVVRKYPYLNGDANWVLHRECNYYSPGLTFSRRARRFAPKPVPAGCLFTETGQMLFANRSDLLWLAAFLQSDIMRSILGLLAPPRKIELRYVAQLPVPQSISPAYSAKLEEEMMPRISNGLIRASVDETTPYFVAIDSALNYTLVPEAPQSSANDIVSAVLGIGKREKKNLLRQLGAVTGLASDQDRSPQPESEDGDDIDAEDEVCQSESALIASKSRVAYLLGCLFGRWDMRFASGSNLTPRLPDPFAPLPACPPGMLQNAMGLPAEPDDMTAEYPLRISWRGILADDAGHPEDIEARTRDTLRVIWCERADVMEAEACAVLGVQTLREYFRKPVGFFADHLKRYSRSRRQAPIYWPLSTPSGCYTLWLYYHRLSDQTLYICVNDFVDPKLKQVSDEAGRLRQKRVRSSADEKALEQLAVLELELTDFRAELLRIATFWKPNLNDGVQITAAPLWRLFQHRPWQKTLKETWENLERGEYDWTHLAMSIWPERVVPKCVTDRSLTIAHDVEDLFWVEDGGRWRNLNPPEEELAEQKRRQQRTGRDQLRSALAALTLGEGRGLRCEQVYEALATGKWDDLIPALLLWPERVAEKAWYDPLLAQTLKIDVPTKRTKAARERFVAERVAAGCPDLADALREALAGRVDRFASLWAELTRGDRDELALALALWPERVVDECAQDVELAGRHGLRRFLWVQDGRGEWRRRKKPNEEVRDEVMRRESRI